MGFVAKHGPLYFLRFLLVAFVPTKVLEKRNETNHKKKDRKNTDTSYKKKLSEQVQCSENVRNEIFWIDSICEERNETLDVRID